MPRVKDSLNCRYVSLFDVQCLKGQKMPTFRSFEEITAWQKARELTKEIYAITKRESLSKDFGLRDQIRRSAVSIMSNIAEGFERGGTKEFAQFLSIAKGSCGETRCQLYIALDQDYIDSATFDNDMATAKTTSSLIHGLIRYCAKTPLRGVKYKLRDE
jgi:four helix bundle protein